MGVRILATRGTESQIQSVSSASQSEGQIAYATDTKDFYVSDGAQFNKIGKDQLSQFSEISIVNTVSSWHLSSTNILDLNPPEANPTGITFKPDGTRMFTIGYSRNRVQMYDLSTAWDLTSAGSPTESEYLVQGGLSSTQEDFFIDSSGTRMYVVSRSSDSIGQFTLNTAWDISDITFVQDIHVNSTSDGGFVTGEPDPAGITFKPDGTIMYIVGYNQDKVQQIPLSTAWDISTHGTITSISISPANSSQGIQFSVNGKEMYILDYSLDGIAHFTLSTAWDVTTANLTEQSVAFTRENEATPTGLFYREDLGKCFIVGRSGDFAREVIANDVFSFNEGITAPLVYAPQVTADRLTTGGGGGGSNNFYNTTYARTTFQADSTTYLGYATSSPLIRLGNNVQQNSRIQVGRFTYLGTETIDDPLRVPRFQFFPSVVGAKSKVYFGQMLEDTAYLIGGSMDIESIADTFDHKGEITLGGELKVAGDKPLAYKNPNLYTQGTQIVLDNFNETTQTTLDNHTPDTGSGYTNVYISSNISFPTHLPIIEANNGFLRPALNNSNDGYRFVNDTIISTANYEARAVIKRQHGGDDPFVLFVKYIDEDNYFAMAFGNSYTYCTPISVVNGVYSTHGYMYYHANTSTADNENIEVALRVVGNNVHLFYEGLYRGSREINITGAGKAGIGFGKMNNSQYTSYDIGLNCHISKFEVYELPDSLFDGSDSVHYIENGKLGIGTTSPTQKLDVSGTIKVNTEGHQIALYRGDGSTLVGRLSYTGTTLRIQGNDGIRFEDTNSSTTHGIITDSGNYGIGTTSPARLLHVDGSSGVRISYESANMDLFYYGIEFNRQSNYLRPTTNSGKSLYIGSGSQNYTWGTVYLDAAVVQFRNSSSEPLMRFDSSTGRLGIGTTSSSEKLHISGGGNIRVDGSEIYITAAAQPNRRPVRMHQASYKGAVTLQRDGVDNVNISSDQPQHGHTYFNGLNTNVGIGTASPSAKLDVAGDVATTGNITVTKSSASIKVIETGGGDVRMTAGGATGYIGTYNNNSLQLVQNGSVALFVDTSRNVGIGTTTPYATLTVAGNITQTENSHLISTRKITARDAAGLSLYNDGGEGIDIKDSGDIKISADKSIFSDGSITMKIDYNNNQTDRVFNIIGDNSTEVFRVQENGRVGIGTTSPQQLLDITDTDAAPVLRLSRNQNIGGTSWAGESLGDIEFYTNDGSSPNVFGKISVVGGGESGTPNVGYPDGHMVFYTRGQQGGNTLSERLRITDEGNVGIGTTTPSYRVSSQVSADGNYAYYAANSLGSNRGGIYIDSSGNTELVLRTGAGQTASIKASGSSYFNGGNVGIGITSPTTALQVVGRTKTSELHASNGNAIYTNQGSVAIGTSQVDATAVLNIASTTKGVLFPRMTSAQRTAISSPATGLIVYQTDSTEGLYIYKSTGWVQII